MISLVVPTLDTLRQWLDDLGMNFFECDTCQALHLPHMQNFDGVYCNAANNFGLIHNQFRIAILAILDPELSAFFAKH